MGLYKRGKVWWMNLTCNDKQVKRSTETRNKKQAERIYNKVISEIAEGKWFERPVGADKTFSEFVEKYLKEHCERNKASYRSDRGLTKNLLRFFGERNLTKVTPKLVSKYKTFRIDEGAAPKTVNNELALLSHAFNLAIKEWEWLDENPVLRVSRERVNNLIERWLNEEEEERLLDVSPQWLREIIVFAIYTGLRQGEILKLRWPLVDLSRRTMTILEQKNRGKDTLPLNEKAMNVLIARSRVKSIRTDNVFFSQVGTAINARNLLRAFFIAREKVGLDDFRFHDLRHTFATRLVQAGVDLYTVQKLGRWKTVSMVGRYAHHYPESLRPGVEVLDKKSTILVQSTKKDLTETG